MANAARTISAQGTGARFGRTAATSQSGTTSVSQSGTTALPSRAACCHINVTRLPAAHCPQPEASRSPCRDRRSPQWITDGYTLCFAALPATFSSLNAAFPPVERPQAIGARSAVAGVGVVIGPTLGGLLPEAVLTA
jgi:MFS family permease